MWKEGRAKSGYAFPMRKTEVPQLGQTPLTAGLPFLSVTFCGFLISMLVLHFTQYAVGIGSQLSAVERGSGIKHSRRKVMTVMRVTGKTVIIPGDSDDIEPHRSV